MGRHRALGGRKDGLRPLAPVIGLKDVRLNCASTFFFTWRTIDFRILIALELCWLVWVLGAGRGKGEGGHGTKGDEAGSHPWGLK